MVAHALLGATLACINGGDPTAGGSAAVASEAAAMNLTKQLEEKYKDDPKYFVNGEFQANLLSEAEKTQIRDLTAGIGAVIGGAVGYSSYNAQLAVVIGQNAVENNNFQDIALAKAEGKTLAQKAEELVKEQDDAYRKKYCAGLSASVCNTQMYKERQDFLKEIAIVLLPTEPYELIPVGKLFGIAIKGTKKLKAVFNTKEEAEEAAKIAKVKVENNIHRDDDLWSNKPSGKQQYDPAFEKLKKIINPKIAQSQNKHILDHKQYAKGKSYFHNSEDAQKVLDAFHKGEAKIVGYNVQKQPIVKFEGGSGIYSTTNLEGKKYSSQTDYYIIKGTQKVSIVPFSPRGPK